MPVGLSNDGLLLVFGLRSKELFSVLLERDLGEEAASNVEVAVVGRLRSGGLELVDGLDVDRGLLGLFLEGRRLAHGGQKVEAGRLGERVERCGWCEARPVCVREEGDHLSVSVGLMSSSSSVQPRYLLFSLLDGQRLHSDSDDSKDGNQFFFFAVFFLHLR